MNGKMLCARTEETSPGHLQELDVWDSDSDSTSFESDLCEWIDDCIWKCKKTKRRVKKTVGEIFGRPVEDNSDSDFTDF